MMQNNLDKCTFNNRTTAKADSLEESKGYDFDSLALKWRKWTTRPGNSPDTLFTSIERFLIGNVI